MARKCQTCKAYHNRPARICWACAKRKTREKDPVKAAYYDLRTNAKRRGKVFTITLDYFRQFCVRCDYITGKGRSAESYHVDRIDETKGYEPGNIQVLPNSDNVKKFLAYDWASKTAAVYTKKKDTDFLF